MRISFSVSFHIGMCFRYRTQNNPMIYTLSHAWTTKDRGEGGDFPREWKIEKWGLEFDGTRRSEKSEKRNENYEQKQILS